MKKWYDGLIILTINLINAFLTLIYVFNSSIKKELLRKEIKFVVQYTVITNQEIDTFFSQAKQ